MRAGFGQRQRQRTEPGTDLDDAVARTDLGEPSDAAHGVGVGDEVLPEVAARARARAREQLGDAGSVVHALPAEAHGDRRVGEVADLGEHIGVQHDADRPAGWRTP